jgi:tetratricopeptide (TPR) repeat protein
MTSGWPAGQLRDVVLYGLAIGHSVRGEEADIVSAVAAQSRPSAIWKARLIALQAGTQLSAGDPAAAVATYRRALDAAQLAADREFLTVVRNNLAGALIEVGDYSDAESQIAAADAILPASSPIRAHLLGTQAELALARGELGPAREFLDRSEALKTRMGFGGGIGWTLATRARLEAAAGNRPEAKRLLDQAASKLQDMSALRAWRQAAAAVGEPTTEARLASPAPDPLVDRAFALAREMPSWVAEIQRGIPVGLGLGIGVALVWLFFLLHDRIPGGWGTIVGFYALLIVLVVASFIRRRFPYRRRSGSSNPGSP